MNRALVLLSDNPPLIQQVQSMLPESIVCHTFDSESIHDTLTILDTAGIILLDDDTDNLIETIDFLRGNPTTDSIPIMLLADITRNTLHRALEAGISDYIPKPLSVPLFMHRWHQMMQQRSFRSDSINQAITNSEYQSILGSMTDPIFVFDSEGTYLKIPRVSSPNYYREPSNLLGKLLSDVFEDDLSKRFLEVIQTAIRTQSTQVLEYDLPIEDGRTYFSAVINPIEGRDEVVWVARDSTRTKLNEIALTETEQRYRQLFENANDMILMVDLDSKRIIDANKKAQTELGYTRSELVRLSITDIEIPLQDTKSRIVSRTLATSGYIIVEHTYRRSDDITLPVEVSSRLIEYRGRKVLLSFARNIKQRKLAMQAEAEERYFAEILRDSIARLASALTLDDVLDTMIATVSKMMECDGVNIMFVEGDTAKIVRQHGYQEPYTTLPTLNISTVFTLRHMKENQQAVVISDAENDSRWQNLGDFNWAKSYVGAPIVLNGETIGYINLDSIQVRRFTNKHRQRLQAFANQTAIAIHNARLFEASQRQAEELEIRVQGRTLELTQANQELLEQIAKRQEAEDNLAQERNILRTIINSLPNAVYVKNRQGEFTLVNYHSSLSDTHPKVGLTDFDIVEKIEDAQRFYQEEQELMDGDYSIRREEYFVTQTGEEGWYIRTKVPLHDDNGEVIGLVGVNQDISDIKLAERQLRQLLSSAQCLLWFAIVEQDDDDYQWNIHVANTDSAQEFLPLDTNGQDYSEAWLASIPHDDQEQRKTIAHLHLSENQPNYKMEYRCRTRDKKEHWLREDVQIRQLTPGRWQLVGVGIDITQSKKAEFALRESHEQLEQRVAERTAELQQEIITRQQAEEAERQQRILAEALQDSITALNNTLNIDDVLDAVLAAMKLTVEHDAANIMLLEEDTLIIVRQRGYRSPLPDKMPLDSIRDIPMVYQSKKPAIIADTQQYDMWDGDKGDHGEVQWVRSNIKIPIIYDNEVIGILLLDSAKPNTFTMEHAKLLQTFANQASIALQNARLYQAEHQQRILAETLQASITSLTHTLDVETVLDTVLDAILMNIDHEAANIMLIEGGLLKVVRQRGYEHDIPDTIPMDWIVDVQIVHDTKRPFIIDDTLTYDAWGGHGDVDWVRCNMKVPIIHDNVVIGLINLDSSQPNQYTLKHAELLQTFANQASVALQNARLYLQAQQEISERQRTQEQLQQRSIELELLREASLKLNGTFDRNTILKITANYALKLVDAECAHVFAYDGSKLQFGTALWDDTYHDHPYSPIRPEGITNRVAKSGNMIVVNSMSEDDHYDRKQIHGAIVSMPLKVKDVIQGVMNISYFVPHEFSHDELRAISLLADQSAIAIQNAEHLRLLETEVQERKRAESAERDQRVFAETLRDTAITLNQQLDTHDLFETILTAVSQVIEVHDTASIIVMNPDGLTGTVVAERGFENFGGTVMGLVLDLTGHKAEERLVSQRSPVLISDTRHSDLWIHMDETAWIRSHISLPIYVKDEILALINLDSQHPHVLNQTHTDQLVVFCHQAAIALQNAQLVEQIREYTQELETRVQQRTAELEQERALIQLERSQLRAILDAMRDGVFYVDNNHQPIYINNALAEMTGYSENDWLSGRVFKTINAHMPIDRDAMWTEIEQHLDSNYFRQDEYQLVRSDGSQFTASLIRTPVKDIDNNRVGIVTAIRDVSLQRQLEEQQSRFIAFAAHELRTPITNIKTRLFLMKHKPEKFNEYLAITESSVNWMQTLVDNLFDHSRFERGIIQLNLEQVVLQELTEIIIQTLQPDASAKQIDIVPVWDDAPIAIIGDTSRLRQVITNLINNAIHYSPENGLISITLRQEIMEGIPTAIISVNDIGAGIEKQHLPFLFQPFYRASDDTKGAGLGLSIAREIIKAHKGTIDVDSQIGEGTTFYVNLPILSETQLLEES